MRINVSKFPTWPAPLSIRADARSYSVITLKSCARNTKSHLTSFRFGLFVLILISAEQFVSAGESVRFLDAPSQARDSSVKYSIRIDGEISTPGANGVQKFPLKSTGRFEFQQRQFPVEQAGPFSLSAIRFFRSAETQTTVGSSHTTTVNLPLAQRKISMAGTGDGLQAWCEQSRLKGKHLDLLEMPFDPLVATHLLTSSAVEIGNKWNTPGWVVPMLLGVDAVVEQKATCQLESANDKTIVVSVTGSVEGAVRGSATKIEFRGQLQVDAKTSAIQTLEMTQKESRSPGPVSPGLDVTAAISWTQTPTATVLPGELSPPEAPAAESLLLSLQTPLKLRLMHSREWHLFHETSTVLMMRQLRGGSLISQCNISSVVTVPPGEHTPDAEFRRDVEESVAERKGKIVAEQTVRDDGGWRIRRVVAKGNAGGAVIQWDYYLCSAATGEQFSIVFSCADSELKAFGDEAARLLGTLSVARRRVALPYR